MIPSESSNSESPRAQSILRALYKPVSLAFATVFAVVGLIFLFIPTDVVRLFNTISSMLGWPEAPQEGAGFYRILAVGYMYLVSLLAYLMFRHPENKYFSLLLMNAKSASAILSLAFFIFFHPYLVFIVNFVVDGSIAAFVAVLHFKLNVERT